MISWNPIFSQNGYISLSTCDLGDVAVLLDENNYNLCILRIPPPPHDHPHYWFILDLKSKQDKVKIINLKYLLKILILQFCKNQTTFWSCLIRCINMKASIVEDTEWTQFHPQMDGQTDRQADRRTDEYTPLPTLLKRGGILINFPMDIKDEYLEYFLQNCL